MVNMTAFHIPKLLAAGCSILLASQKEIIPDSPKHLNVAHYLYAFSFDDGLLDLQPQ